jgi:major membrane immunogen (membrane-anchored lipoprotein)
MKSFILAAIAALTIVLAGCASSGDLMGTRADGTFPEGTYSNPE